MWEYVVTNIEQTLCSIGGIRLEIRSVHISTFQPNLVQSQIRFSWKIPQWNFSLWNLKKIYSGGVLHEDYNDVDDYFEDKDPSWKILIFPIFLIHLQSLLSASSSIAFHSILSQFIFKSDFCILGSCYCNNLLLGFFLSQGDLDISENKIIYILNFPSSIYVANSMIKSPSYSWSSLQYSVMWSLHLLS